MIPGEIAFGGAGGDMTPVKVAGDAADCVIGDDAVVVAGRGARAIGRGLATAELPIGARVRVLVLACGARGGCAWGIFSLTFVEWSEDA